MKSFSKFWFAWLVLTAVYLGLIFTGGGILNIGALASIVGIFVPYGVWNAIGVANILEANFLPLISLGVFIALLFYADKFAEKNGIVHPVAKILYNLILLVMVTALVDLCTWGKWTSALLFVEGFTHF